MMSRNYLNGAGLTGSVKIIKEFLSLSSCWLRAREHGPLPFLGQVCIYTHHAQPRGNGVLEAAAGAGWPRREATFNSSTLSALAG